MPNPNNNRKSQQWDTCDRCGLMFPMGQLVKQKGLLVCTRRTCFDNLEIERRELKIEQAMSAGVDQEGSDLRAIDRGFFEGFDEVHK